MNINNADIFGKIKNIEIKDGIITEISDTPYQNALDIKGKRLISGLIDVHTHGCNGTDAMQGEFSKMCGFYAKHGTTSFLPTTMTMDSESLKNVCDAPCDFDGANILGIHLEGPYISKKYKGAQNEKYIKNPDIDEFLSFNNVAMITVAPELEGGMDFVREASKRCCVSLGHTDCDYETALKAIENGANCLTHTYNAMPPLHHRKPGPIGAAFEKGIYAQLICDGFHISKPAVMALYKTLGADRVVLISDSLSCAGLPDGEYESGGLPVMLKNGAARLHDGTIAGSCAMLWDCVKTAVGFGIPFEDAVKMASQTPAELLKVKKGRIEVGFDADLLVVNDDLEIEKVIISGKEFC